MREGEKPKENHLLGLFVPYEFILDLLFAESGDNRIYVNKIKDIPDDAKLLSVRETWEKQGFIFILEHSSFHTIYPGEIIPTRNLQLEIEVTEPKPIED